MLLIFCCAIGTILTLCAAFYNRSIDITFAYGTDIYTGSFTLLPAVSVLFICLLITLALLKWIYSIYLYLKHFKTNLVEKKKTQAIEQVIKIFANYMLDSKDAHVYAQEFLKYSKILKHNKLYWTMASVMKNNQLNKLSSYHLEGTYAQILTLKQEIDLLIETGNFQAALSILEQYEGLGKDSFWFKNAFIKVLTHTKHFEKAYKLAGKDIKAQVFIKEHEFQEKLENNKTNRIEIASWLYETTKSNKHTKLYIKELLILNKHKKALEVASKNLHNDIELGELLLRSMPNESAFVKFDYLQNLKTQNPKFECEAVKYILAKTAIEAGFYLVAREELMELAQSRPDLAFPLLATLEQKERHDQVSANMWLERAVTSLS